MSALVTADWSPYAGNKYFRKIEVYSMLWQREVNFETCGLTAAQSGGPIVVLRDRAKLLKLQGPSHKPIVAIYSSSGKLLSSFIWDKGQLVQLGWSSTEELLFVQEDGKVLIYNMFGVYQHAWDIFLMAQDANGSKIVSAIIFPSPGATGVAVITSANEVFVVNNVNENHRRVRQLPKCPGAPTAWAVICEDRQTKVIMSKQQNLYTLEQTEVSPTLQRIDLGAGSEKYSIVSIAVSPDSQKVALFINNGNLWIKSSDLRKNYRRYDTHQLSEPKQIVWCGSEAVVCYWGSTVTVIGCLEDSLSYVYDYPVFLVSEIDCVRLLSPESHHIIQCVPEVVQEMFKINSLSPGSYLLEASKQFQKRSHRANEYIHIVKPNLTAAVTQCIQAAGHEFNTSHQKMLMTAAQLGKCFLHNFDSSGFVKMCRILRLLNQVRDPQVGISITYEQLEQIGIDKLIDMLILRRYYYLALQMSKYLRLSNADGSARILSHWAYYKVKQPVVDKHKVAKEIHDKIGLTPGISYTDIATEAASHMNVQLAIRLLDYEPCATKQVPHLLKLGQEREALVKAVESGNTDLVYTVILTMKSNMNSHKFQMEIRNYPMAQALYIKYCKSHNKQALNYIYEEEGDHNNLAATQIKEAFSPIDTGNSKESCLQSAKDNFKKSKNEFAALLCEEEIKLMKYQRQMEQNLKYDFLGLTLHETLEKLLSIQNVKLADNLRTEYKVPDKRYWWLRIKALGQANDWVGLDKFSKAKKSPIGYEPFLDVCMDYRNKFEAQKYLARVREDEKVKYLVKLDMMDEALQTASVSRDLDDLEYIASKSQSLSHAEEARRLLAQLSSR